MDQLITKRVFKLSDLFLKNLLVTFIVDFSQVF